MVMINCSEYNAEISDSTLKCTKCGYRINKPKRGVFGKIIKWSLFYLTY
jgi:DNA-directed RNA polymerase subunit RPC12/RpoP